MFITENQGFEGLHRDPRSSRGAGAGAEEELGGWDDYGCDTMAAFCCSGSGAGNVTGDLYQARCFENSMAWVGAWVACRLVRFAYKALHNKDTLHIKHWIIRTLCI